MKKKRQKSEKEELVTDSVATIPFSGFPKIWCSIANVFLVVAAMLDESSLESSLLLHYCQR